jgi:hypothetical protein
MCDQCHSLMSYVQRNATIKSIYGNAIDILPKTRRMLIPPEATTVRVKLYNDLWVFKCHVDTV